MEEDKSNYKSMAKSSGIIAFVQLFQMIFSLLRNKLVAVFIGANGFGIWSLLHTLLELATSFSTFGLDQGGVREIAKNSYSREATEKCIFTFRMAILIMSMIFCLLLFIFANEISIYIFNSQEFSKYIRIISITVVLYGISKGGYAILNGLRALKYLAISQIISSVIGSIGAIVIIYFFREKGIPYALSIVFLIAAIITSLYVYKLKIQFRIPTTTEFKLQLKKLLYLGLGFTIAGLVSTVMTMMSRSFLNSYYDLNAVGIYQASWTISNLYIGIILTAMGIDFMPRLSKVASDNNQMNLMINQQIQFGMVLASAGITLILLLSPLLLRILYSAEFVSGVSIIRWQILGVALRIIAFPFGYSIMAKNKPIQYAVIQTIFWIVDYLFLILFSEIGGFNALGVNYFCAYVLYLFMTYLACKYNHKFSFSKEVFYVLIFAFICIIVFWLLNIFLEGKPLYFIGSILWLIQCRLIYQYCKIKMNIDIISLISAKIKRR